MHNKQITKHFRNLGRVAYEINVMTEYRTMTYDELESEIRKLLDKGMQIESQINEMFSPSQIKTIKSLLSYHLNKQNGYGHMNDEHLYHEDLSKDNNGKLLQAAKKQYLYKQCYTIICYLFPTFVHNQQQQKAKSAKTFLNMLRDKAAGKYYWPVILSDLNPQLIERRQKAVEEYENLLDNLLESIPKHKRYRPCVEIQ